jgi:hypothetical protein
MSSEETLPQTYIYPMGVCRVGPVKESWIWVIRPEVVLFLKASRVMSRAKCLVDAVATNCNHGGHLSRTRRHAQRKSNF